MSYAYLNCIIVICNHIYVIHKTFRDFNQQKLRKAYPENSGKNVHFPETAKSYSGHPKTCKYIKNRKSKICTKPIISSSYIEESNKELQTEKHNIFIFKSTSIILPNFNLLVKYHLFVQIFKSL